VNFRRAVISIILIYFSGTIIYSKFHHSLKWREISRNKFIVIYPSGYKDLAIHSLLVAEELYPTIRNFWKSETKGKVRILLHDSTDYFDEGSSFFPYNWISIALYPPEPNSLYGNYSNHVKDVIRHGLNRIFVYNFGSRILYFLRKHLGANLLFFPTFTIPGWAFAGVSTSEEINSDSGTRFHSPEFDLILREIAVNRKFPKISSLQSKSLKWPGPFSPDIFGVGLQKFLLKKEGVDKIRNFVKNYASHPIPLDFKGMFKIKLMPMSTRFEMALGRDLYDTWEELENFVKGRYLTSNQYKSLTNSGYVKKFIISLPDSGTVFFSDNFKSYSGVYMLKKSNRNPELLFKKKRLKGISYFSKENKLYFSAVDAFRKYYDFADLYKYDFKSKKISRITKGARLTYPVRSGNKIYCIKRDKLGSYLAYYEIGKSKVNVISNRFGFLSGLSISPDSGHIASSVKTVNNSWRIGIFNKYGKLEGLIESGGDRDFSPVWCGDDKLMFVSSTDKHFQLASFNVKSRKIEVYNGKKFPVFKFFDLIGNDMIVAATLNGDGYDLMRFNPEKFYSKIESCPFTKYVHEAKKEISLLSSKRYNALRDFIPKYFTIDLRAGGRDLQLGFFAEGFDLIRKHSLDLRFLIGLNSGRSNFYLNYVFNGLPGELSFELSKFNDLNENNTKGDFIHTSRKFITSFKLPLFVNSDSDLSFYTDIHFEKIDDEFHGTPARRSVYNGFRVGININSTEVYYNSISENDGFRFNAVYSLDLDSLGSRSDSSIFTLEYSQFFPLFNLNVLGIRFSFAKSWDDGNRELYMGGTSRGREQSYSDEKLFGILRGYPPGCFSGTSGFSVNFEIRMLLKRIERSFLIFKSIESIYLSLFADTGQMWRDKIKFDPAVSVGGELNLIFYLGSVRYIFTSGIGYGVHPKREPVFYFRLGSSF